MRWMVSPQRATWGLSHDSILTWPLAFSLTISLAPSKCPKIHTIMIAAAITARPELRGMLEALTDFLSAVS